MSKSMPTTGADPKQANAERKFSLGLTRMSRTAFSIYSDQGRIARKRKKFMYITERRNYIDLLRTVAIHLARVNAPELSKEAP